MKTKKPAVKALSIAQPWAECIVSKGKNVENRSWNTNMRGFVAIHASAAYDKARFEACHEYYRIKLKRDDVPFGAIVGFAEITDVVSEENLTSKTKKWFMGDYGFVLNNVIKFKEPVPAKGNLGFWKVTGKTLTACLDQLSVKDLKKILSNLLS